MYETIPLIGTLKPETAEYLKHKNMGIECRRNADIGSDEYTVYTTKNCETVKLFEFTFDDESRIRDTHPSIDEIISLYQKNLLLTAEFVKNNTYWNYIVTQKVTQKLADHFGGTIVDTLDVTSRTGRMSLNKVRFRLNVWETDPVLIANKAIIEVQGSVPNSPLIYGFNKHTLPMVDIVDGICIITLYMTIRPLNRTQEQS